MLKMRTKGFLRNRNNKHYARGKEKAMASKVERNKLMELKQMVKDRPVNEPVEKILAIFCQRHGLQMSTCRKYYEILEKEGEIKEK